jgi:hypothetical protein
MIPRGNVSPPDRAEPESAPETESEPRVPSAATEAASATDPRARPPSPAPPPASRDVTHPDNSAPESSDNWWTRDFVLIERAARADQLDSKFSMLLFGKASTRPRGR